MDIEVKCVTRGILGGMEKERGRASQLKLYPTTVAALICCPVIERDFNRSQNSKE